MLFQKKNKLVFNFVSLGLVQALISLLQLLVIPYAIKKIGVDGFGVVAVAQVVMLTLSAFTDYSFNQTATRDVSLYRSDRAALSRIFSRVLFTKLFLCFFAFIILLILILCVPVFRSHTFLYLMAFVFVIGQSSLLTWFFQGLEKMHFIALLTLSGRVLFAVLVFIFIKNKSHDFLFLFFLGIGTLIAGAVSIFSAWRMMKLEFIKPSRADIAQELRGGWQFTLANLSSYSSQFANIFILRIFTNDLLTGYYGIAERIFFTGKQVLVMFSQIAYPRVCLLVQSGKKDLLLFWKRAYLPFFICVVSGSLLVFLFSRQVLYFFMGNQYFHSVFFLRMFCIVSVIVCLNIPATLTLLALNHKKIYSRILILGMILNIVSNTVLAQLYNATGTIISIVITESFIMIALSLEVYRHFKVNKNLVKPG